jgi:hypothetical protein
MKSSLLRRSLATPGRLQSVYHFLPPPLQYGLLLLAASMLPVAFAIAG